ncbi:putative carbamate hydrolase [Paenarthrobacter nicotinovorans]|nr:putative carbamate hydrolase [Paenarthrobacter nicotinovorans]
MGAGIQEQITIRNYSMKQAECLISMQVDADFADLFEVKEARIQRQWEETRHVEGDSLAIRAAWQLPENPSTPPKGRPLHSGPVGWHLERERIGTSRSVLLELVVNGQTVASQEIHADGSEHEITFDIALELSSWIALRILRSVHTQPIFLELARKPIRTSRRSAQWLHDSVDSLWNAKAGFIRPTERTAAQDAYKAAKAAYLARREECDSD